MTTGGSPGKELEARMMSWPTRSVRSALANSREAPVRQFVAATRSALGAPRRAAGDPVEPGRLQERGGGGARLAGPGGHDGRVERPGGGAGEDVEVERGEAGDGALPAGQGLEHADLVGRVRRPAGQDGRLLRPPPGHELTPVRTNSGRLGPLQSGTRRHVSSEPTSIW